MRLVEEIGPDVLLANLSMRVTDGLEVMGQIRRRAAATRIIVTPMRAYEAYVVTSLRGFQSRNHRATVRDPRTVDTHRSKSSLN